ncbi:hypothetical protein R6Q57_027103 [Mikania cordata]
MKNNKSPLRLRELSETEVRLCSNSDTQIRVMYNFLTNYVSKNPRGAFLNYQDLDIGVMAGTGKNAYIARGISHEIIKKTI